MTLMIIVFNGHGIRNSKLKKLNYITVKSTNLK